MIDAKLAVDDLIFARFKMRFIVAASFHRGLGIGFALWTLVTADDRALLLGALARLHAGSRIARIYDAQGRARSTPTTSRLDFLLARRAGSSRSSLLSPAAPAAAGRLLYDCGVPTISSAPLDGTARSRSGSLGRRHARRSAANVDPLRARGLARRTSLKLALHARRSRFWAFCTSGVGPCAARTPDRRRRAVPTAPMTKAPCRAGQVRFPGPLLRGVRRRAVEAVATAARVQ